MSTISKPSIGDLALLLLIAIIWGSAFSSIKVVVAETGALWGAALRVGLGFVVVLPFLAFAKESWKLNRTTAGFVGIVALLNMVIPFMLINWSLKHIDAGVGSLLLGTTPIAAMIIGHFTTQDERITSTRLLAVASAMTGIMFLVGFEALYGLGSSAIMAQLAVVMSGVCYVSAGFVMRRIDAGPVVFTAWALGAGTLMLTAIAFSFVGVPSIALSNEAWINLIWLGTAPTGLAYLLRYWLIRRLGVSTFALAMNAVPIFGILIGATYLQEEIHWTTIVALVFVLGGLMIARYAVPKTSA